MSIETFEQFIKRSNVKKDEPIKEEVLTNEVSECEIEIQLKDTNKELRNLLNVLMGFKGNIQLTKENGEIIDFKMTDENEILNLVVKDYNKVEVMKDELITDEIETSEIDTEISIENEQEE